MKLSFLYPPGEAVEEVLIKTKNSRLEEVVSEEGDQDKDDGTNDGDKSPEESPINCLNYGFLYVTCRACLHSRHEEDPQGGGKSLALHQHNQTLTTWADPGNKGITLM